MTRPGGIASTTVSTSSAGGSGSCGTPVTVGGGADDTAAACPTAERLSGLLAASCALEAMDLAAPARVLAADVSAGLTTVVCAVLAVVVAALVPRRRVLTALAGLSVAVVLGLTLVPNGGWGALGFETGPLHSVVTNLTPRRSALTGWLDNDDGPANVVLYLPAGLFLALASRRPVRSAVGLAVLSLLVECWQATLTTRVGSFDDVVANALGAALGAVVAALVLAVRRAGRRHQVAAR